jgi:hypothetical protein
MSLKDLFEDDKNLRSSEPLTREDINREIESFDFMTAVKERNQRFLPVEEFADPSSFARFGSAEKYYEDSITRIYETYPYDGSLKEKVWWEISSSYLDLYLFENGYPRTTGYANFVISAADAGGEGPVGDLNFFPSSGDDEYILTKGGPHPGTTNGLYHEPMQDKVVYRKDANIYDVSKDRENNLKIGGTDGNTVEFWLKKDAYVADQEYLEFVLDAHVTGTTEGDADYGRFFVALATSGTIGNSSFQPFLVGLGSASADFTTYLGSGITTGSVADGKWHHYAVRTKTTGSDTVFDLFVDGEHNDRYIEVGATVGYVSGAIVATWGALAAPLDIGGTDYGDRGWAKFSGSLDEVRYWKTFRTSQKIQRYWFSQVGGGTNTDIANVDLGVYYKFNEGITQTASVDSKVLDFSGRISNGVWTGYSEAYSRSPGSAILESSASAIEFKDPIIYPFHPEVKRFKNKKKLEGRVHDDTNAAKMDSFLPQWMLEANETDFENLDKNQLLNAMQIIASYFDSAAILIDKLPTLKHEKYYSSGSFPAPFNKHLLEGRGFLVPDLFINADLLEQFENRNNDLKFDETLQKIKNTIYQNIYNNLTYIYKSKGTQKAFRNLIRCFGLGDNVLKFNIYSNNGTYKLEDNTRTIAKTKNYVNFNTVPNGDASVYQYQIDSNATSYLSGSQKFNGAYESSGLAFTLEGDFILPNRVGIGEYATVRRGLSSSMSNHYPLVISASLFGMHSAVSTENDLTWNANDYANFQVFTAKDDKYSSSAKFVLTGTAGGFVPELTSSLFEDIYDDDRWTISVTLKPTGYPYANQVSGAYLNGYVVQFYGSSHIADIKRNEFLVTGTITHDQGRKMLASHKRVFVGAHRTNFTGSRLQFSDVKATEVKAWYTDITTASIDQHNMKIDNFGTKSPAKSAFLYQGAVKGSDIPEIDTLALRWNFNKVTGSDAAGEFSVEDASSGSASDDRFGWFSGIVNRRHTASGSFFAASSTTAVQKLERGTLQQQVPEALMDSNLVNIIQNQTDDFYTRNSRPTTYNFSIEKNLFQDISEEMLNMFASIGYLNTLIGTRANRYRGSYKELIKQADKFFETVDNNYDFDKYVEYFKYIDYAMSQYIEKLVPASLQTLKDGISTVIENFVLGDRNKFRNKAPGVVKEKLPEFNAQVLGINELDYNWKFGHGPLDNLQNNNCLWWRERANRNTSVIASDNAAVNANRQTILNVINNETNAPDYTLKDSVTGEYSGSTFAIRRLALPYSICGELAEQYKGGVNFHRNKKVTYYKETMKRFTAPGVATDDLAIVTEVQSLPICNDEVIPGSSQKFIFPGFTNNYFFNADTYNKANTSLLAPFNIVSSSLGPRTGLNLRSDAEVTNLHHDVYGPDYEHPMQGTFTEKFVGGNQHRHQKLNTGSSNSANRGEAWAIDLEGISPGDAAYTSDGVTLLNPAERQAVGAIATGTVNNDLPRAVFFREPMAKRPVNIKNIQQTTGSRTAPNITNIGNYSQDYEIVLSNGRSINNVSLVELGGITASSLPTPFSGVFDYTLPQRGDSKWIFVNRFSAPGGPEINGLGAMDIEAAEYSVYNALPWRNLTVRGPLNELLSDHSKQFGYFSDAYNSASYVRAGLNYRKPASAATSGTINALNYEGSASFQKVNRNTRLQPTLLAEVGDSISNHKFVDFEASNDEYLVVQTQPGSGSAPAGMINDKFSFSAWIKAESVDSTTYIAGHGDFGSSYYTGRWILVKQNLGGGGVDGIQVYILGDGYSAGAYKYWRTAEDVIYADTWTHVAFTYDASLDSEGGTDALKIYIDGVESTFTVGTTEAGSPQPPVLTSQNGPFTVGTAFSNAAPVVEFDGGVDEPSYWNTVLTPAQIAEIYSGSEGIYWAGRTGPGNLKYHSQAKNLVSWWRMGDDPNDSDSPGSGYIYDQVNTNNLWFPLAGVSAPSMSSDGFLTASSVYLTDVAKSYDNFFVQHPIPQTDLQYAWITASVPGDYTGSAKFGYEKKDFRNASLASTDIAFLTASDFGAFAVRQRPGVSSEGGAGGFWGATPRNVDIFGYSPPGLVLTDFAGINSNIYEPIASGNFLGYHQSQSASPLAYLNWGVPNGIAYDSQDTATRTGSFIRFWQVEYAPQVLNSLLSHRQGPYGWPTWKQIRGSEHPIVRYQKKKNILGYVKQTPIVSDPGNTALAPTLTGKFTQTIVNFTEPSVTTKYKPLRFYMEAPDTPTGYAKVVMSYANENALFTDQSQDLVSLGEDLTKQSGLNSALRTKTYSPYLAMKALIETSKLQESTQVSYTEIVYPKDQYSCLSGTRRRLDYENGYWRDLRLDRLNPPRDAGVGNSMGDKVDAISIPTASIWSLDPHTHRLIDTPACLDGACTTPGTPRLGTYSTSVVGIPYSATLTTNMAKEDGSGELLSCYGLFHYSGDGGGNDYTPTMNPQCAYIRRIPLVSAVAYSASAAPGLTTDFSGASRNTCHVWNTPTVDPCVYTWGTTAGLKNFLNATNQNDAGMAATTGKPWNLVRTPVIYSGTVGDTSFSVSASQLVGNVSGTTSAPFYDTYNDYAQDGVSMLKGGTILPEFRISEKMSTYIANRRNVAWTLTGPTLKNFKNLTNKAGLGLQNGLLELTGTNISSSIRIARGDAGDSFDASQFLNRYAFSDFYKHFTLIKNDFGDKRMDGHLSGPEDKLRTPKFSIGCEAVLKFLPYKGFYPADRTLQLGTIFSASITDRGYPGINIQGATGSAGFRTIMQPFFAPGILYNSIKSGIAVDYPIATGSMDYNYPTPLWKRCISGSFSSRVNFEQLADPPTQFTIYDTDPLINTRINCTASWQNPTPTYKFAMNNFLAETVNFFLDDNTVTRIHSAKLPIDGVIDVPKSGTYYMDVALRNSRNIVNYRTYEDKVALQNQGSILCAPGNPSLSSLGVNQFSITMYSRAITNTPIDSHIYGSSFGPPVLANFWTAKDPTGATTDLQAYYSLTSFVPFTPPYYDGYGYARLKVGLNKGDGILMGQVLNNISRSYGRMTTIGQASSNAQVLTPGGSHPVSPAQQNAMQVSASINLGQPLGSQNQTAGGSWLFVNEDDSEDQRLIIHPKFECPILDFQDTDPVMPVISGNVAQGMWHQYGSQPRSSEGIYMMAHDPSTTLRLGGNVKGYVPVARETDPSALSLAELLKFSDANARDRSERLGGLNNSQKLSEAIVAIPFKYNNATGQNDLYKMNKKAVQKAKNSTMDTTTTTEKIPIFKEKVLNSTLIRDYRRDIPEEAPEGIDDAIYDLLRMMRKYVIPPQFDFLHFNDIDPFAIYIWEFEMDLDAEDLQNIWQNIAPKEARKALKVKSAPITHLLPTRDIEARNPSGSKKKKKTQSTPEHPYFEEIFDEEQTRWAVFKVKKRARNNFANVTGRQKIGDTEYVRDDVAFPHDFAYSYNWPHDFYSLIELGEISTTVEFNPQDGDAMSSENAKKMLDMANVLNTLTTIAAVPTGEEEE